jgi:hypothetical protein
MDAAAGILEGSLTRGHRKDIGMRLLLNLGFSSIDGLLEFLLLRYLTGPLH